MERVPVGVFDLAVVTQLLIQTIEQYRDQSPIWGGHAPPFNIEVTGAAPDAVRTGNISGCALNVYLFHVGADPHQRNTPRPRHAPVTRPPVRVQPFGLDLYYLVTAFAGGSFVQEQQAMSVALRCFHDNAIIHPPALSGIAEQLTLTLEMQTFDELGRLWQAMSTPSRLAAVYKAGVVFMTAEEAPAAAAAPTSIGISAGVHELNTPGEPQLFGTRRIVTYRRPHSGGVETFDVAPAVAGAGDSFTIFGARLDATSIYLLTAGGEQDISSWVSAGGSAADDLPSRRTLTIPVAAPPPGVYQVRVGIGANRSSATPFSICARVDPPLSGEPPLLAPVSAIYTLTGAGFLSGATELLVGGASLTESAQAPGPGEFRIAGGASMLFRLPSTLGAGVHEVRVRVNGVQSPPAWWVELP